MPKSLQNLHILLLLAVPALLLAGAVLVFKFLPGDGMPVEQLEQAAKPALGDVPLKAEMPEETYTIDDLVACLENRLNTLKRQAMDNGLNLKTSGRIDVEEAQTYYALTFPEITLEHADGNIIHLGIFAMNVSPAMPGRTDLWQYTLALPGLIRLTDTQGRKTGQIEIGTQNNSGILDIETEEVLSLKSRLGSIRLAIAAQSIGEIVTTYEKRHGQGEDGKTDTEAELSIEIKDLLQTGRGDGAYRLERLLFTKTDRRTASGTDTDLQLEVRNAYKTKTSGPPAPPLPQERILNADMALSLKNPETDEPATAKMEGTFSGPADLNLALDLTGIPVEEFREIFQETVSVLTDKTVNHKLGLAQIGMRLLGALEKANTKLTVNTLDFKSLSWAFDANTALMLGRMPTGNLNVRIRGLDYLINMQSRKIAEKATNGESITTDQIFLSVLAALRQVGAQSPEDTDKMSLIYNLTLTEDGQIILNGQSSDSLGEMLLKDPAILTLGTQ